jgi:hypothetical protein
MSIEYEETNESASKTLDRIRLSRLSKETLLEALVLKRHEYKYMSLLCLEGWVLALGFVIIMAARSAGVFNV